MAVRGSAISRGFSITSILHLNNSSSPANMYSMNASKPPPTETTLTGSWRSFSPKLDPQVADRFREIEAGTLEALREAALKSGRLMEEAEAPPMKRP